MPSAASPSPPATASAGEAWDQYVEESDDGTDDALEDGSDSVNDGHETGADSAEHSGDLLKMLEF